MEKHGDETEIRALIERWCERYATRTLPEFVRITTRTC